AGGLPPLAGGLPPLRLQPKLRPVAKRSPTPERDFGCLLLSYGAEHREVRELPACDVVLDLSALRRDRYNDPDANVVLDRGLHVQRRTGVGNSGLNEDVRRTLAMNETFCELVRSAVNAVLRQWEAHRHMPGVLVNCRWGKHRSVAAVETIAEELRRRRPQADVQTVHLERPRWHRAYSWTHAQTGLPWPPPAWVSTAAQRYQPWTGAPVHSLRA
ncbi:MAG: hypothetical protein GY772_26910, partial [bacterium]|nr:hypothetical protein [bacterium]